jgi:hypothetical protein
MTAELEHLIRLSETHPNWAEYATWKANALAQKRPREHGDLPMLLSNALESSATTPSEPSKPKLATQPETTAHR